MVVSVEQVRTSVSVSGQVDLDDPLARQGTQIGTRVEVVVDRGDIEAYSRAAPEVKCYNG